MPGGGWLGGQPQALALAEALADHGLALEANFRLGQVHWSLGQYREAVTFFERCLPRGQMRLGHRLPHVLAAERMQEADALRRREDEVVAGD
jgi:hypothetical protein